MDVQPAVGKMVIADADVKSVFIGGKRLERKPEIRRITVYRIDQLDERMRILSAFSDCDAGNHGKHRFSGLVDELEIPALEIIPLPVRSLKNLRSPNPSNRQWHSSTK